MHQGRIFKKPKLRYNWDPFNILTIVVSSAICVSVSSTSLNHIFGRYEAFERLLLELKQSSVNNEDRTISSERLNKNNIFHCESQTT